MPSAPVLQKPDFLKIFEIHTDNSDTTMKECLNQTVDGEQRVTEYYSHVLNAAQMNYSIIERATLEAHLILATSRRLSFCSGDGLFEFEVDPEFIHCHRKVVTRFIVITKL